MYLRATALIFCLFGISYGEEITVAASKDNTLYESSDGSLSNGVGFYLFAGATAANGNRRALIYFDLSDVPAGSTVHSAVLQLHMDKSNAGSTLVSAHRLRSNWGEGNSAGTRGEGLGAGAASSDATWLHTFYPDEFWLTSGGDYETQPSAAQTVGDIGDYQWEGIGSTTRRRTSAGYLSAMNRRLRPQNALSATTTPIHSYTRASKSTSPPRLSAD